jgi:cell division protein FtsQ
MKNFWQKIKHSLIMVFWLLCCAGVITLLGASVMRQHELSFQNIVVSIDDANEMLFIDENDMLQLLKDHQVNLQKAKPVNAIDYYKLEKVIESNPFVESAEVFVDANEKIRITVKQRLPILRIINNQGVSYYLDEYGSRMPVSSKFTARVPVATGFIFTNSEYQTVSDLVIEKKLFTLAHFIQSDSFLTSLTEQIIITKQNEIELIPMIGNHSILIGDENELNEKFDKLKIFYKEGLNHTGWDQYSKINLKYANEVYCTKREMAGATVDSVGAN